MQKNIKKKNSQRQPAEEWSFSLFSKIQNVEGNLVSIEGQKKKSPKGKWKWREIGLILPLTAYWFLGAGSGGVNSPFPNQDAS